jgi:hypothetical protein
MRRLAERKAARKAAATTQPMAPKAEQPGLPDFELAPLASLRPSRLRSANGEEREIDALMLGLGLIFNDLKDFLWFFKRLGGGADYYPQGVVHAQGGQLSGMSLRIMRSIAATLHELLKLLDDKRNKRIMQGTKFQGIVEALNPAARSRWDQLNELARGSNSGGPARGSIGARLKSVRDKSGSHYAVEELQKGYAAHFSADARSPTRQSAYYSDGENMERSRFHFADAAAEGLFQSELGITRKEFENHMYQHIEHVNEVLKLVLTAWLHARGGAIREKTALPQDPQPD